MSLIGLEKWVKLWKMIKQNGGIRHSTYKLWRFDTLKDGKLVGWDSFGNRYYQNDFYMIGRSRWVEHADAVKWDYDGPQEWGILDFHLPIINTQITAEWYGWIHYKTDRLPCDDPAKADLHCCPWCHCWLQPHQENNSGTEYAYYPYSTVPERIYPWDGSAVSDRRLLQ